MIPSIPCGAQLVLDFDGVVCDSALECLYVCWYAHTGAPVDAFAARDRHPVPVDVAERYRLTRPFMRHLEHFVVPLLDGPAPVDRATFAARFDALPEGLAKRFAADARAYRAAVRERHRERWLALHGVWRQVARLAGGAYIATARDSASVVDILAAHGVHVEGARIYAELTEKVTTLALIAERESLRREEVCLLDDSIDNCLAARAAGFGAAWASWGCGDPGDAALARARRIPVLALADLAFAGATS
jgi:phosphoglycolate phosphatase-like HAD superfamily hydrolase